MKNQSGRLIIIGLILLILIINVAAEGTAEYKAEASNEPISADLQILFNSITTSSLTLAWEPFGDDSYYTVTYSPVGSIKTAETIIVNKSECLLEGLIPATVYIVNIKDKESEDCKASGTCMTLFPENYTDYLHDADIGNNFILCSYIHKEITLGLYKRLDEVIESNMYNKVTDSVIPLPRFTVAADSKGYFVLIMRLFDFRKAITDTLILPFSCVLRVDGGISGTFRVTRDEDVSDSIGMLKSILIPFSLDEMLDAYFYENGGWYDNNISVEIYIGDRFVVGEDFFIVR